MKQPPATTGQIFAGLKIGTNSESAACRRKVSLARSTGRRPSSPFLIFNSTFLIAPAFTLIEMLTAIVIIALLAALVMPVIGFVQKAIDTQASSRTVAIAVETARQLVNERAVPDKKVNMYLPGETGTLVWAGAAALFTATGQIRFIECNQLATGNLSGVDADSKHFLGDSENSTIYHGYVDVPGRSYPTLPSGRDIAGIIRTSSGLCLIMPPFAVRFNKSGILVSGNPETDSQSLIIYDGNYNNDFGDLAITGVRKRTSGYQLPSKSELWNGNRYMTAFERIESVIGVVLFDPDSPSHINLTGDGSEYTGCLSQQAENKIFKRGKVMFFNRYTGVPLKGLSYEK